MVVCTVSPGTGCRQQRNRGGELHRGGWVSDAMISVCLKIQDLYVDVPGMGIGWLFIVTDPRAGARRNLQ